MTKISRIATFTKENGLVSWVQGEDALKPAEYQFIKEQFTNGTFIGLYSFDEFMYRWEYPESGDLMDCYELKKLIDQATQDARAVRVRDAWDKKQETAYL